MRIKAILGLALAGLASQVAANTAAVDEHAPRHAFIGFHQPIGQDIADELTLAGVTQGIVLPSINTVALVAPLSLLREYQADPRVRGVRLQRKLDLHLYESVGLMNARGVEHVGPNAAHKGVTGAGITVGVVDSGIYAAHPDLLGRVVDGYNFEFSLLAREAGVVGTPEWDAFAAASKALALVDDIGHGTHVAGTIGGDGTAASGLDLRGVAPGVDLISFKMASGHNGVVVDIGFEANAVAAFDFILRNRRTRFPTLRVINNSWGILEEEAEGLLGPTDFDPIKEVTAKLVADGMVVVFSAGNDGPGPDTVRPIPNGMDEVITVASACKGEAGSCPAGQVNGFSSRGESVDIAAPGDEILAAQAPSVLAPLGQVTRGDYFGDMPQDIANNRAFYMRLSGTSMSSPHIAGVVALVLEANPHLSPAEVQAVLTSTADDITEGGEDVGEGFDTASGAGMVNVRRALEMATAKLTQVQTQAEAEKAGSVTPAANAGGGGALGGLLLVLAALRLRRR